MRKKTERMDLEDKPANKLVFLIMENVFGKLACKGLKPLACFCSLKQKIPCINARDF